MEVAALGTQAGYENQWFCKGEALPNLGAKAMSLCVQWAASHALTTSTQADVFQSAAHS